MIGSSDIWALAGDHEEADSGTQRSSVLPRHLSLPPLPRPWPHSPSPCDCVLLCDFEEVAEPQLLFTTPPTPKSRLHAALRLLTGGYQAMLDLGHSGRDFLEDSWAFLGDGASEVCVYARYMRLLDPRTGGGMWPVAMAMVSHDPGKLLQELQHVDEAFSWAAHTLKTGNTHTHTLNTHTLHTDNTHTHTLNTHARTPQQGEGHGEEEEGNGQEEEGQCYEAEPGLLAVVCDWSVYRQAMELLCTIQRSFRGDGSLLAHQRECGRLLPPLWSSYCLFEGTAMQTRHCVFPSPSSSLQGTPYASCVEEVPIRLQAEKHCQSQPSFTLDPMATTLAQQEAVSVETSSQSSGDSIEVLATQRSVIMETAVGMVTNDSVTMETEVEMVTNDSVTMETAVGVDKHSVAMETDWGRAVGGGVAMETGWGRGVIGGMTTGKGAERTDSQDSIEVLSRDSFLPKDSLLQRLSDSVVQEEKKSFLPEDFRAADSLLQGLMGTVVQEEEEWLGHVGSLVQEEEELQGALGSVVQEKAKGQRVLGAVVQEKAEAQGVLGSVVQEKAKAQVVVGSVVVSPCPVTILELCLHDTFQGVFPLVGLLPLCPIGGEDKPDNGRAPLTSPCPCGAVSWRQTRGEAALRLVRGWSHIRHAVFSLLIGRPLVVVGGAKEKVQELVHALEFFLPSTHTYTHTHRVLPWCCRPIHISDLLEYSIIGLNSVVCGTLPSLLNILCVCVFVCSRAVCVVRYHRYLTLLDADHMTLLGPAYRGALIGQLTEPQSHVRGGRTYSLLVQCAFTRLAAQAFHQVFSGQEAVPPQRAADDVRILNFLCDVIKLHLTHHNPSSVLRFNYTHTLTLFR
ncbi:hypothetical protein ACEWY4_003864 [Coilia grayii]|uniref:UDENN FLCN/SMCR8-type domain-containing protein n=1 Tax=Coilia grayii TaxID=363190 RepID=A0ABD1KK25_9TELE